MKKVDNMKLSSASQSSQGTVHSGRTNLPNDKKLPGQNNPEEFKNNAANLQQVIPIKLEKGSKLVYQVHADLMQVDPTGKNDTNSFECASRYHRYWEFQF